MADTPLEPLAVGAPTQASDSSRSATPPIGARPPAELPDPVADFSKDESKKNTRRESRAAKPKDEAKPADAVAEVETPVGTDAPAPVAETPSGETPESTPPPETKPAAAPVAAEPIEHAPAGEAPAVEQPTVRHYADDERIALGANPDGSPLEWTRGQIVDRLRKAIGDEAKAGQADVYHDTFQMSAEDCAREWKPLLGKLQQAPYALEFLQQVIDAPTPAKVAYLQQCAAHFDEVTPPEPNATAAPANALPPEMQKRLDTMEARLARQDADYRKTRANNEWGQVTRKYPFLLQDEKLGRALWQLADQRAQQLQTQGVPEDQISALLDVVGDQAALLDARLIAYRAQHAAPAADPTPPARVAVLGGGMQPGGTQARPGKPMKFDTTADAVEAAKNADLTR